MIRQATEDLLAGASIRWVAADLNRRGVTTTEGGKWRPVRVRDVLQRARNAGLMRHRGEVVGRAEWGSYFDEAETVWGCIVSESQWLALRALLADPARRTSTGSIRRHLGSGLYECGVCGKPLRHYGKASGGGGEGGYRCADPDTSQGRHVSRNAEALDLYVTGIAVAWLEANAAGLVASQPDDAAGAVALTEVAALRERLNEQAALHAEGVIDGAQLAAGTGRLRALLAVAEDQARSAAHLDPLAAFAGVGDARQVWEALSLPRRQAVIRAIMTVRVLPVAGGKPKGWQPGNAYFREDGVDIIPRGG